MSLNNHKQDGGKKNEVPLMKIKKSKGVTTTEKWLSHLCERTFLKLWSWPNPCKQDRKELCDLIAIFDEHVFIFFDRESRVIQYAGKKINVAWPRWKKAVIDKQIKTANGAERYIKSFQPIFLDVKCERRFPVPISENPVIHKIIVAHGAEDACKSFSEDNVYGSLGIVYEHSEIAELSPFFIRLEKDNPIHVLDSSNLEVLLTELDTFCDFALFIDEKEKAIRKYDKLLYCGEEDLLAHYFLNYDKKQKKYRIGVDDSNFNVLWIEEGKWKDFKEKGLAAQRREVNKESYVWDKLIQKTYQNALDGTTGGVSLWSGNDALHEMAKEPRLSRRTLSRSISEAIRGFPPTNHDIVYLSVCMQSLFDRKKMYVFLQVRCPSESFEDYRRLRQHMLVVACGVIRNRFPDIKTVIGIAMDAPKYADGNSEDFVRLNCKKWSEEQRAFYDRENEKFDFFKNARKEERRVFDFE